MVFIWVHCKASVDFFIKQLPKNHQNVLTSRTNWEVHHTPLKQWLGFCRKRVPLQIVGNSGLTLLGPSQLADFLLIYWPACNLPQSPPAILLDQKESNCAGCGLKQIIIHWAGVQAETHPISADLRIHPTGNHPIPNDSIIQSFLK